jgi:hypothetical protein
MHRQESRSSYRPEIFGIVRTAPLWLPLAVMATFFTPKSHAALFFARNLLIHLAGDRGRGMFDSHRPLQFQPTLANASQLDF